MIQHRFIQQTSFFVLLLTSLLAYIALGYFTPRIMFHQLIILFTILFAAYGLMLRHTLSAKRVTICIAASLLFRISLLFMIPNLSDDYFRFIWDGRLLAQGINPYTILPRTFINTREALNAGLDKELFTGLNSPGFYTVYPPVAQAVFAMAGKFSPHNILGSIIAIRSFLILAETGTIYLIIKLLREFNLPKKYVLFYALNPLVIIELSGNLHFEAVMIFWLLLSVYLLTKFRPVSSAVCFALAVGTKLIPLIFLPFLIKRLGFRTSLMYYLITGATLVIMFTPFIDKQLFPNFFSSVDLYFQQFEFNSSIYCLLRWVEHTMMGCSMITYNGIALSTITFFSIVIIAYREKHSDWSSLFKTTLLAMLIYYVLATTVHPWYITVLIVFSAFVRHRFIIIWSALIPLSYIAYQTFPHREDLQIGAVTFEYLIVIGFALYEFFIFKRFNLVHRQGNF